MKRKGIFDSYASLLKFDDMGRAEAAWMAELDEAQRGMAFQIKPTDTKPNNTIKNVIHTDTEVYQRLMRLGLLDIDQARQDLGIGIDSNKENKRLLDERQESMLGSAINRQLLTQEATDMSKHYDPGSSVVGRSVDERRAALGLPKLNQLPMPMIQHINRFAVRNRELHFSGGRVVGYGHDKHILNLELELSATNGKALMACLADVRFPWGEVSIFDDSPGGGEITAHLLAVRNAPTRDPKLMRVNLDMANYRWQPKDETAQGSQPAEEYVFEHLDMHLSADLRNDHVDVGGNMAIRDLDGEWRVRARHGKLVLTRKY